MNRIGSTREAWIDRVQEALAFGLVEHLRHELAIANGLRRIAREARLERDRLLTATLVGVVLRTPRRRFDKTRAVDSAIQSIRNSEASYIRAVTLILARHAGRQITHDVRDGALDEFWVMARVAAAVGVAGRNKE